jgi:hypothetical protein
MSWARRLLAAILAGALLVPGAAAAAPLRAARLARVHTWAFAIGAALNPRTIGRLRHYDLVVLDGQEATRGQIAALHRAGTLVLGYLDVGTIEAGRPWYPLLAPYRMDLWGEWGEWYARVDAAGYRRAIAARIAPRMLAKGFDGLFLDNTDMIETHPAQAPGMRALVGALAGEVHASGRLLFSQNGEDSIGPLLHDYDGWNREDVSATYDFARRRYVLQPRSEVRAAQAALRRIRAAGLLVLATDYVAAGNRAAAAVSQRDACAAGALPFLGDIELTRVPATPVRCP